MSVLVGKERPHLIVAQTCPVKTHVRTGIVGIEVEAAAQCRTAPLCTAAYPVAVKIGKILTVDTLHLRYMLYRQRRGLSLRLLKKPRTRR